jgi:predicted transcriptional regulator
MGATRTQIYLTDEQRRRVDELARSMGVTLAEVVRRALDRFIAEEQVDPAAALRATFGADPGAHAPSRDEWDRG